jgi:cyclic pyranopterin phosphate synthase
LYLRVSLTDRCNLRCVYCLPESVQFAPARARTAELRRLVELVVTVADVRKIRLTGGEPTLCDDLVEHVAHARTLVPVVGLTTNGVLLEPLLSALRHAGLNRLNISLDALDAEGFRRFARRDGLDRVVAAIRGARRLGFAPLKVNAVAMAGTDFPSLARFAAWEGVHVRFIELMAIGEARAFQPQAYVDAATMRARIGAAGILLSERTDRDEPTARIWAIDGHDPAECSVGFITTVSQPFCATCDRLRLSSQGRLFTCLMDNRGHDLLTPLRAGDEDGVRAVIAAAVRGKRPPAEFVRFENMAAIGG